ncbi:MAG TPA: hypothetical protein VFF40_11980 [Acidimicrobiia bacterium]|nr:hypothetical protein [Acidimicrobiia bacterium]
MTDLEPGTKLASVVCATEVVVIRAPSQPVEITCGGVAMVPADGPDAHSGTLGADATDSDNPTLLGKRYASDETGLELLCAKAGDGSLACNGTPLPIKGAKPLPSSD